MKLKPNCKIWLERGGEKVFGDGPCDILQRVERTGSLRAA
ncbi:MAG: molybdenum-binding protein, partial [Firmicutes bacterium]|nr:molybdenum-binding protein [Bacillota bacterium]